MRTQDGDEVVESADAGLVRPNKHEFEFTSVSWAGLYAVQGEDCIEPVQSPCAILHGFKVLQRRKLKLVGVAAKVEVPASAGFRRSVHGQALVENEDIRFLVSAHLHGKKGQSRGLAGARGAEHDRMADVPDVEVQTEGAGAGSDAMAERGRIRWIVRTGMRGGTRPDGA